MTAPRQPHFREPRQRRSRGEGPTRRRKHSTSQEEPKLTAETRLHFRIRALGGGVSEVGRVWGRSDSGWGGASEWAGTRRLVQAGAEINRAA